MATIHEQQLQEPMLLGGDQVAVADKSKALTPTRSIYDGKPLSPTDPWPLAPEAPSKEKKS